MGDSVLFIKRMHWSFVICRFKYLCSLKSGGFWLAVSVCIIHHLEKINHTVIPTIFLVIVIVVVWIGIRITKC